MDTLKAFFQGMTLWNWLALIAFCFATISVLNAFLSLKSRYHDWRSVKSKKEFEVRRQQLEYQLKILEADIKQPIRFFTQVLDDAMQPIILFMGGCCLLVLSSIPPFRGIPQLLVSIISLLILINALISAIKVAKSVKAYNNPQIPALEFADFMVQGMRKGYIPNDTTWVSQIYDKDIYTAHQRIDLEEHVMNALTKR